MGIRNIEIPVEVLSLVDDRYYDKVQGKWFTNTSSRGMFRVGTNVQYGTTNPGYKDRILKGEDASSAYTRRHYTCEPGLVRMSTNGPFYDGFRVETYYPSPLPSVSYDATDVTLDASARLKRKLREFSGHSNQLTNLVELRELPKTIGSVANSASKLITTVLNSKRRGGNLRKFASDQWLTWSFGVLPTLGAIDDAISSVKSYLERDDHSIREYGIFQKDWTSSNTTKTTGPMGSSIRRNSVWYHTLSCKITAGYRFQLLSANNYTMAKHLGFDISSVVPTAWELLPYSWLVDYFTTAGSFIEDSFSASPGTSIYICQTVKYRVIGEEHYSPVLDPGWILDNFYTRPTKFQYVEMTRTPLVNLPRAPLRFKTKEEIASNAVTKLLNLASLLGSKK
ncbi:TPA_asm: maturation protein [ssRNA phage SRR7976325_3]|uniref:Maturation protein n=1 Tax=ssRNA phage SRR7976325_3 TaxID=2786718 RepID=A0A8S5L5C4_9VIRU|nr:maturation protein [ssRNA phage SRR7976325_3]DAD52787.1 TPA_asm: maturation protein [ssRNA phage SRR7976325_3]